MGVLGAVACLLGSIGLGVLLAGAGLPIWVVLAVVGLFAVAISSGAIIDVLRR